MAKSKLVSSKYRLDREVAKQDELQKVLNEMREKFAAEKKVLCDEHKKAVDILRRKWDSEKEFLLEAIQTEFNKVFEEQRQLQGRQDESTRSEALGKLISKRHKVESVVETPKAKNGASIRSNTKLQAEHLPFSKVDAELRETEALVLGLIEGEPSLELGCQTCPFIPSVIQN